MSVWIKHGAVGIDCIKYKCTHNVKTISLIICKWSFNNTKKPYFVNNTQWCVLNNEHTLPHSVIQSFTIIMT